MSLIAAELPLGISSPRFRIYALGEKENFPMVDFLDGLKHSDLKSYLRLMATLKGASERGPNTHDETQCRLIKGIKEPIYELKTKNGSRVLWFYDEGHIMLCTTAFHKPPKKRLRQDVDVSINWFRRYFAAKTANQLTFEHDE